MVAVTPSSRFQITISKAVREELHLQVGQRFAMITKGDIISLVPIRPLDEMRGIFKGANTSDIRDRTDRLERYKLMTFEGHKGVTYLPKEAPRTNEIAS